MKITFITANLDLTGGSRIIAKYAEELSLRGHEVTVMEYHKVAPWYRQLRGKARSFLQTLRQAPSTKYRDAHFDEGHLYKIKRLSGVGPLPATLVPDADAIVATWWETAEWVSDLPSSKGRKFYFIQGHEVFDYLPVERVRATYRAPLKKIVISRWLASILEKSYQQRDVVLIPNAIDHQVFDAPSRQRNISPVVGFVYSSIPFKGSLQIVEAITQLRKKFPGLKAISFGTSPPAQHGQTLPDFVEFHLRPPQTQIPKLYAMADAWLIGSESEGFCLPALESAACGTPVISTRTGWPAEGIVDGRNGFLYDYGDQSGIQQALEKLLDLSNEAWHAMSREAQHSARQLTWQKSVDQFEATLRHTG